MLAKARVGLPRMALAALLCLLVVMTITPVAQAATSASDYVSSCSAQKASASDLLPVNRWADSTTWLHSRLDAKATSDLSEKITRNGVSATFLGIGNAVWGLSTSMLSASSRFCPLDTMGSTMDTVVGSVGSAMTGAGLITALTVWTVVSAFLSMRKGRSIGYVVREVGKTAVVLGVIGVMLAGAARSTTAAPGTGSPWWWIRLADRSVTTVSTSLAGVALDSEALSGGYAPVSASAKNLDATITCLGQNGYMAYLDKQFDNVYGRAAAQAAFGSAAGQTVDGTDLPSHLTTTDMNLARLTSRMWETLTLPVWTAAQFGTSNPWGDNVFCFVLEDRALPKVGGEKMYLRNYVTAQLGGEGVSGDQWRSWADASSLFRADSTSNSHQDRVMVAMAACQPDSISSASVREPWDDLAEEKSVKSEDCTAWWTGGDIVGSSLDWDDDEDKETKATASHPDVRNYLANLHGKGAQSSAGLMFVYLLGSVVAAAVFILLAALQLGSKLILVAMILAVFLALVRSLAPGDDSALFKNTAMQVIGASFVSGCAGIIIAMILVFSGGVAAGTADLFEPGSTGAVMVTCLGPALGVWFVHFVFTKVLSLPSPFTFKGAATWASGIVGGVVGGGVVSAVASARGNAHKAAASRARRSAKSKPDGKDKPKAPGAASGAENTTRDRRSAAQQAADSASSKELKAARKRLAEQDRAAERQEAADQILDVRDQVENEASVKDGSRGAAARAILGDSLRGAVAPARQAYAAVRSKGLKGSLSEGVSHARSAVRVGARTAADTTRAAALWGATHPVRAARAAAVAGYDTATHAAGAARQVARDVGRGGAGAALAGTAALAAGAPGLALVGAAGAGAAVMVRRGRHRDAERSDRVEMVAQGLREYAEGHQEPVETVEQTSSTSQVASQPAPAPEAVDLPEPATAPEVVDLPEPAPAPTSSPEPGDASQAAFEDGISQWATAPSPDELALRTLGRYQNQDPAFQDGPYRGGHEHTDSTPNP